MTALDQWKALLRDVEAATGADREIDERIADLTNSWIEITATAKASSPVTASLNAVVALVEREMSEVEVPQLMKHAVNRCIDRRHCTYAQWLCRAMLAAFICARIAEMEQTEEDPAIYHFKEPGT